MAFDLFNEPHDISWSCWLNGCTTPGGWVAVGMQQLINAVRATGASQPVIAEGLAWGGDLSGWLAHRPSDPGSSWPVGTSTTSRAVTRQAAGTAPSPRWPSRCPSWATEVGENDCAGGFLGTLLPWADAHGIGCLAWAWDTASCGGGPSLITAYDGIPAAYGAAYKQYLASRPQPLDPTAKIDFEDGSTDGFGVSWGSTLSVAPEAGTAYSGSHGLALTVSGSGYPATATGRSLTGLGAGSGVTYHVWAPTGVSAGVSPMYFDSHWAVSVLSSQSLQPGWNTIAFTIPGTVAGLAELGLQVNDGSGWTGRLAIDDIGWSAGHAAAVSSPLTTSTSTSTSTSAVAGSRTGGYEPRRPPERESSRDSAAKGVSPRSGTIGRRRTRPR